METITVALINAGLAQGKELSWMKWFLISLILGPIATFWIVMQNVAMFTILDMITTTTIKDGRICIHVRY